MRGHEPGGTIVKAGIEAQDVIEPGYTEALINLSVTTRTMLRIIGIQNRVSSRFYVLCAQPAIATQHAGGRSSLDAMIGEKGRPGRVTDGADRNRVGVAVCGIYEAIVKLAAEIPPVPNCPACGGVQRSQIGLLPES